MKPQDKAKELVEKSMPLAHDWESDNKIVAIKIALLCVDEIIKELDSIYNSLPSTTIIFAGGYWQDVKSEIKKL